jgi:hypothetical protein
MSRKPFGWSMAGMFILAAGLAAQEPAYPQPPSRTPAAQEPKAATVTVEGCLVREQDVPGRKPNVAERAGVLEDYILTNTKIVKGSAPQASAAKPGETVGTAGTAQMYDVKGLSGDKLKELVGKRVQIEGAFADVSRSPAAGASEDLVDIQGTTIRAAAGDCPAK